MKPYLSLSVLTLLLFLLTACPVGLQFPPAVPGSEKIDRELIGTWETNAETEVISASVRPLDNFTYDITVLEKGEMYALENVNMKGYVTTIENTKILYLLDAEQYYLYAYSFNGGNLSLFDISLKVKGVDGVVSTEALRQEIRESLKLQDCLSEERIYTKK